MPRQARERFLLLAAAVSFLVPRPVPAQTSTPGTLERARQHCAAGDFSAAEAELHSFLAEHPRSAEAHALLAFAEWRSGRPQQAAEQYRAALRLDSRSFSAHYNLAMLYFEQHQPHASVQEFRAAAALQPGDPGLQYNFGVALLADNRAQQALPHLEKAAALSPGRPDTAFQLFRAHLAVGLIPAAVADSSQLATQYPESRPSIAAAWLDANQPARALLLLAHPTTAEEHFLLARTRYALGSPAQAVEESQRAIALDPQNAPFLLFAARLLQRTGSAAASSLLDRAIAIDPSWFEPYYVAP